MEKYTYILGPCSIESEENFLDCCHGSLVDGWMAR